MRVLHIDTGRGMRGGQFQVLLLLEFLAKVAADASTWRNVRRLARRCDLIHAHDARAHTLAALHGSDVPLVVSRRVAFSIGTGPASRWKYSRAAHYVAVSRHVSFVLQRGGVPRESISVVYDAAPACDRRTTGMNGPRSLGTPKREFRVAIPNIKDPLKGRDLATAACRSAGVTPLVGNDLARDLQDADALLYLSRTEGLGSAILLAMSLGVPTIASNVGGIPEVIEDGVSGLLVNNDADAACAAIRTLQSDEALRQRLANEGRERVRTDFSAERMADRTARVYRRVLESS